MAKNEVIKDWDECDLPAIEDLSPGSVRGVAERVRFSRSFEELVYRECELDALWTIADMMVRDLEEGCDARRGVGLQGERQAHVVRIAELLFQAHDDNARGDVDGASRRLEEVASLSGEWLGEA